MELHVKIGLIIEIDKVRHKRFQRNHMQRALMRPMKFSGNPGIEAQPSPSLVSVGSGK